MNVDKLVTLVDQHAARQTNYRHLSSRYRQAVNDEARQMAEMTAEADDLAEQIVLLPLEKLVAVPPEEMEAAGVSVVCLLYTSPSPRDRTRSRMPSSA